ncbi:MAG: TfoX/Sxy family protein [Gammaproteobacteria bacterium]|nr:TfoX/Sxy family protein [Gammaproteobacteria bacterium]
MKIIEMKNLGPKSSKILANIGIHTKDQLEKTGAVDTYLILKNQGYNVNLNMLYALESALLDINVNHLSNDIKQHLQSAIKAPKL